MTVKDKWSATLNEAINEYETDERKKLVKKPKYKYTILFKSGASISDTCSSINIDYRGTTLKSITIYDVHGNLDKSILYLDADEIVCIIREEL